MALPNCYIEERQKRKQLITPIVTIFLSKQTRLNKKSVPHAATIFARLIALRAAYLGIRGWLSLNMM